jgi:hypothetical protein
MKALGVGEVSGDVQWDWAGPGPRFGRHFGECWGWAGWALTAQKALVVAGTVSGLGLS